MPTEKNSSRASTPLYLPYRYVSPLMVWFLRRFGPKKGTDFAYFGLNSSMVFEEMHESICRFNSKLMNKKERVICEVEVDFIKKSFCWRSNLSNDNTISAYARYENGYGF